MIYIMGDIHGNTNPILIMIDELKLTKTDTIVLLGDVGLNFYGNYDDIRLKKQLNDKQVPILCIHGNHEKRPETIASYKEYQWHGGVVYKEPNFPSLNFAKDGEVYDFNGKSAIAIGGAYSVDKEYRLKNGYPWWPDEQPSNEIKKRVEDKLSSINWTVDYIFSHTCPLSFMPYEMIQIFEDDDKSTEEWLQKIENKLSYKKWFFGHYHMNYSGEKYECLYDIKRKL